jgi:hypothetical protein
MVMRRRKSASITDEDDEDPHQVKALDKLKNDPQFPWVVLIIECFFCGQSVGTFGPMTGFASAAKAAEKLRTTYSPTPCHHPTVAVVPLIRPKFGDGYEN